MNHLRQQAQSANKSKNKEEKRSSFLRKNSSFDPKWLRRKSAGATVPAEPEVDPSDDAPYRKSLESLHRKSLSGSMLSASRNSLSDVSPHVSLSRSGRSRSRHGSQTSVRSSKSEKSHKSEKSQSSEEVRRKLSRLFFWERDSLPENDIEDHPMVPQRDPDVVPFPKMGRQKLLSVSLEGSSMSYFGGPNGTITPTNPPISPENMFTSDSPGLRDRRESVRSRSSSLGLGFPFARRPGSVSSPARKSTSSDDFANRQDLPLPPAPTIGIIGVADDPDVVALGLDPMAVRYADHLHMLGWTRNRNVCALLAKDVAKDGGKYNQMVMEAYLMRMLRFQGEPLDMSLRKLLYRVTLPSETQQIERVLLSFSDLYHYHNPGLFTDAEQVLYVVFSLVMLHTDVFNRNVRHKMSKQDYVQYATTDAIAPEIFEYFYDNITAVPFRKEEEASPALGPTSPAFTPPSLLPEEAVVSTHRSSLAPPMPSTAPLDASSASATPSLNTSLSTTPISAPGFEVVPPTPINTRGASIGPQDLAPPHALRSASDDGGSLSSKRSSSLTWLRDAPTDPYPYLLENRLDSLRPTLSVPDSSPFETTLLASKDLDDLRPSFAEDGPVLQLVSQRSRPDAYLGGNDIAALEAQSRPGIVEIRVVKHGTLLRREPKKILGGHKSGWKEWGAVLTESRLYLFRHASWVKQLSDGVIKAPIDALQSAVAYPTRGMAAILKSSRLTEDNVCLFMLSESGGRDDTYQWLATTSDADRTDWIQKINVSAALSSFNLSPLKGELLNSKKEEAVEEIARQIDAAEGQVQEYLRMFRHLRLLAPLQQRSRESVMFAVGRYSSRCDNVYAELAKLSAYKNVIGLL